MRRLSGRSPEVTAAVLAAVGLVAPAMLVFGVLIAGCGAGSSTVSEDQLREARKAGEEAAHERDRVDSLQRQVRNLRHQVRQAPPREGPSGSADAPRAEAASQTARAFHVASGNVSCEMSAGRAVCTVEPTQQSFVLEGGEAARVESVTILPPGVGELVPYGSTVTAGSISCEIPPSNVPHGITCVDTSSGHGFEASRVANRQKLY
jgi:hypothetical protein